MEFERINEDTIRVVVSNDDLHDRGVSITDLLGNQEEIEHFFYGLLEEADIDYAFLNKNDGEISFQVLPNRNGMEVYISNQMPDQELMEGIVKSAIENRDPEQNGANDDVSADLLKRLIGTDDTDEETDNSLPASTPVMDDDARRTMLEDMPSSAFIKIEEFEDVLRLANVVGSGLRDSQLYENQHAYFFDLQFEDALTLVDRQNILSIALEYGKVSPIAEDVIAEHGHTIFATRAIEQLNQYF